MKFFKIRRKDMAYILGVDIGTSGTKTVLFSEDGTPVASALYDYRCV